MKQIKTNSVLPGDIILTARPDKTSQVIRIFTGGIVSHAMICVQHGSSVDSTPDGVQARNLQRVLFEDDELFFHFRLKDPVSSEIVTKIIEYARAEIGARYDIPEAALLILGKKKSKSKRLFCSRLVARVYRQAGIDLVPNADYCSPEDLRNSGKLVEISVDAEILSEEELRWRSSPSDPISKMHEAQNKILNEARSFDSSIETFDDLYSFLKQHENRDTNISYVLHESGYLDLWRIDAENYPWRYEYGLIDNMTASEDMAALREYCVVKVKEAYTGSLRFAINLIQLRALNLQYPRQSFSALVELYEKLVENDQVGREIAYKWLLKNYSSDLKQHMEQIEPHSVGWYLIIDKVEPKLAALSRHAVASEKNAMICSSCGDEPVKDYRIVNGAQAMPGVPSLRLCSDCFVIRTNMGCTLMPFL